MSLIYPFAALRPVPEVAARVAAVPYDVVSTDEARALAAGNPLSFLHVSRPEIDLPPGADPHGSEVYARAAANFAALKQTAPLVMEEAPSFYVYRLHMGAHVQAGIAACFSVDEYDRNLIRKHEKTRPDKEDDRTRHMLAIEAQTGPVFLTYKASPAIDAAVARVVEADPLFDFTAPDDVRHVVWRVPASEHVAIVDGFAAVPVLYIADGHHRAASAARARQARAKDGPGEWDRVMAVAFPDNQVQVLPYNRVVRDLHGRGPEAFLQALGSRVTVREGGAPSPERKGLIAMRLAERWYTLDLARSREGAATALDVDVLEREVLEPLLGIVDVRTDKRIEFVGGIRGTDELERLAGSGAFAVAFSMYPVSLDDLMRIADAGGIMPPKSTWFEPKLRDGLLSHVIA
ncbi:MAG: DUF1015 domain-containing protein [Acidobacteria bacterium]|nr:DUF1015 domain-containing protein [Acidobacteriota bacterium]